MPPAAAAAVPAPPRPPRRRPPPRPGARPAETRRSAEAVQVNLLPRYPLFGGWAAKFTFGFSLPLSASVQKVQPAAPAEPAACCRYWACCSR